METSMTLDKSLEQYRAEFSRHRFVALPLAALERRWRKLQKP